MEEGVIKESDLVSLDGTIDKLINSISDLNATYSNAANSIAQSAAKMASSLKTVSGATKQGRQAIDDSSKAAARLAAAEEALALATSEVGKQIAWLKAQTVDANKATVKQQRQLQAAASSYDGIKLSIEELTGLFKSLTAEERKEAEMGQAVIAEIREKTAQLKALDATLKPVVQSMTALQKAEQDLAYWQSEEGQRLLEVRKQIRQITADRKEEVQEVDALTKAKEKLAFEQSDEAKELAKTNEEIKKQQALNRLLAKEAIYVGTTYKDLQVQYEITKQKIEQLDKSSEDYSNQLAELTSRAAQLRKQMADYQASTGNYALNVGNYSSAFDSFGQSVQQVVRELPTLRFGLDQFFLAISNNLPIFADMYAQEKRTFEGMRAEIIKTGEAAGKSSEEIADEINALEKPSAKLIKSLFSWRTALVLVVTAFTLWGEKIISWVGSLITGTNAVNNLRKATKAVNKELKSSAHGFDDNMTTITKLSREWKNLKTTAEKTKWIKDNESAWSKLDVAMTGVADAEDLFVKNTTAVRKAFMLRAKAAAAEELAKKKYAELLKEEVEKERLEAEGPKTSAVANVLAAGGSPTIGYSGGAGAVGVQENAEITHNAEIKYRQDNIDRIQTEIDAYYKLADASRDAADDILGLYKKRDKVGRESSFDLEDYIAKMRVKVSESADKEQVKSTRDAYRERQAAAQKELNAEVNMLLEVQRKNKKILDLRLKDEKNLTAKEKKILKELTPERIAILEGENAKILKLLEDFEAAYDQIIKDILTEERIARINTDKELIDMRLEFVQEGSEDELNLRLRQIELEKQAAILANNLVADAEKKNVDEIIAYYKKLESEARGAAALSQFRAARTTKTANLTRTAERGRGKPRRQARREVGTEGSLRREVYEIDTQLLDVNKQLELYYRNQLNLSEEQLATLRQQKIELEGQKENLAGKDGKVSGFENFMDAVDREGLGGGILEALGLDEAGIEAFNVAVDAVIDGLNQIVEAEIEAAEAAVEAAQERVSAAQAAYDAEIEARNNGYANSVDTARKELEDEKKNEDAKQKMLEQARKKQQALDAATQASSLVTAVAGLWASYSTMGPASIALAGIATAALFAAFLASQIKAAQVAKQAYGEGGLEFLEGGSHASGNDIPLGTVNSKGKAMRAEGGEAMAIINKRNAKRYRHVLPDLIDSLNKGTFEDKYLNAFGLADSYNLYSGLSSSVDLSDIEGSLHDIRNQGKSKTVVLPDGSMIITRKNTKRIIRKS